MGLRERTARFLGHALGTERPQAVEKSHGSLVAGHPANGRSDAADQGGEAVGESLVCAVGEALHNGKRGRPKKTLPKGATMRCESRLIGNFLESRRPPGECLRLTEPLRIVGPTPGLPNLLRRPLARPLAG